MSNYNIEENRYTNNDSGVQAVQSPQHNNCNNFDAHSRGSWVVEIYRSVTLMRFIVVKNSNAATFLEQIKRYVEPDSVIHTDEWPRYSGLSYQGYIHQTVNRSKHFVDLVTGAHTQGIVRAWKDAK